MFQLDLPHDDYWEQKRLQKKRADEERKKRIFHPDQSHSGVDLAAVEMQILEKKQREEQEKREEQMYRDYCAERDRRHQLEEQRKEYLEKKALSDLQEYWTLFQRAEQRQDWDMQRPAKERDDTCYYEDGDPRVGPSSMLRFAGEDNNRASREQYVLDRNREAWDKQIEFKKRQKQLEEETLYLEKERGKIVDEELEQGHQLKLSLQQAIVEATKKYNKSLAQAARERRVLEEKLEQQDNMNELYNSMNSTLLNEQIKLANKPGDPKFDPAAIKAELELQIAEKKQRKEQEALQEAKAQAEYDDRQRRAYLLDNKIEKIRKIKEDMVREENRKAAESQKQRRIKNDEDLGTNIVDDRFFDQFQTSAR